MIYPCVRSIKPMFYEHYPKVIPLPFKAVSHAPYPANPSARLVSNPSAAFYINKTIRTLPTLYHLLSIPLLFPYSFTIQNLQFTIIINTGVCHVLLPPFKMQQGTDSFCTLQTSGGCMNRKYGLFYGFINYTY